MDITKLRKGAILFAVLLLPSLCYVILSSGDHSFTSRPYYGPKTLDAQGDTVYYSIPDFSVNLCNGELINSSELENKIFLISFFDPKDSISSARINGQLMTMQDRFRDNNDIVIYSISYSADSADKALLCRFEEAYPVREGKWFFGTLDQGDMQTFATRDLMLPESSHPAGFDVEQVVMIDKKGRIRSYRNGTQYVEIKELVDDVKVIKAESFITRKITHERKQED